jgi:hypothetical protein
MDLMRCAGITAITAAAHVAEFAEPDVIHVNMNIKKVANTPNPTGT